MCFELSLLGAIAQTSSTGAQYVTLQNYFWHQDYLYLHFSSNLTHKTKTGTANSLETTGSHPFGSIKLSGQSIAGVSFCCAFYHSTWAAPT
jgi:hypothetical protein